MKDEIHALRKEASALTKHVYQLKQQSVKDNTNSPISVRQSWSTVAQEEEMALKTAHSENFSLRQSLEEHLAFAQKLLDKIIPKQSRPHLELGHNLVSA